MSLKCSVLGHSFGETTVERDREEDGTEVVITITELETCTRCGETRVVSENKEVTTLETPDDAGESEDAASPDPDGARESAASGVDLDPDPDADDAEILEDEGAESTAQSEARTSQTSIPDAEGETGTAAEEDAVIIGDDGAGDGDDDSEGTDETESDGSTGSDPGAWPEGDDEQSAEEADADHDSDAAWPDDGVEPTIGENRRQAAAEPTQDADRSAGEWPDETTRPEAGGAVGIDLEAEDDDVSIPEGMFKCSECGFTTEIESSSLRAGDFCPECHRGTLLQNGDAEE